MPIPKTDRELRKAGLQHDDIFVRSGFLSIFLYRNIDVSNTEISHIALDMIEKYGWLDAFQSSDYITTLAIDDTIVPRVFEHLSNENYRVEDRFEENHRVRRLTQWFLHSPPEVFNAHEKELIARPDFDALLENSGTDRQLTAARMRAAYRNDDKEECLKRLDDLVDECISEFELTEQYPHELMAEAEVCADRLAELGAINSEWPAKWIKEEFDFEGVEVTRELMRIAFGLILAKAARIPLDLKRCLELADTDWDWICDLSIFSIQSFLTPEGFVQLVEQFPGFSDEAKMGVVDIFKSVQFEGAEKKIIALAGAEDDWLLEALLGQIIVGFGTEAALDCAYRIFKKDPDDPERIVIAHMLFAFRIFRGDQPAAEFKQIKSYFETNLKSRLASREQFEELLTFSDCDSLDECDLLAFEYNPAVSPNPEMWQQTDEGELLSLIQDYVEFNESDVESPTVHAAIHLAVENQIAATEDSVPAVETMLRLITAGVTRHNAIHAIGSVTIEQLHRTTDKEATPMTPEEFTAAYHALNPAEWLERKTPEGGHLESPGSYLEYEGPNYQRETAKIGRNDACPCGSGKKYKKCCQNS